MIRRPRCARSKTPPGAPWKDIAGTRDHSSHGYDNVDYQGLWDAVQTDFPVLLLTVEQMLADTALHGRGCGSWFMGVRRPGYPAALRHLAGFRTGC